MFLRDNIILAIDSSDMAHIDILLDKLSDYCCMIKLGLEFFTAFGPRGVEGIASKYKKPIFLDLKLHDIPNTVFKSVRNITSLDVSMLTIHISGGKDMVSAALEAASGSKINIMGVTVLTSMDVEAAKVVNIAREGISFGLKGLICSAMEVSLIREFDNSVIIAVPGIRMQESSIDDHNRSGTPEQTIRDGANYIVVGRAITTNKDPVSIAKRLASLKI